MNFRFPSLFDIYIEMTSIYVSVTSEFIIIVLKLPEINVFNPHFYRHIGNNKKKCFYYIINQFKSGVTNFEYLINLNWSEIQKT